MGEWSDYFEDFPEEAPANQEPQPGPLERAERAMANTARKNSLKERDEVQRLLDEAFSRKKR